MPARRKKTLVDTIRAYTNDPAFRTWEDYARDLLHIEASLGGTRRHLTFGDVTAYSLESLDDEQRATVVAGLFENAGSWPAGIAQVRCVRDGVVISEMVSQTDLYVFVNDFPVSPGVRISMPMTSKA